MGIAAAQAAEVPVVERALGAACGLERIAGGGLFNEGLGLAALDALGQIDGAARGDLLLGIADARLKSGSAARGGERFFKTGKTIGELAGDGAPDDQAAAGAVARSSRGERVLEAAQIVERGLERAAGLLFFEMKNTQQAAQGAGRGHEIKSPRRGWPGAQDSRRRPRERRRPG
jgi:hypothetical protein